MIKVIVFIRKRADITAEQFRHHYETVHAPLIDELLPYYSTYRRNYVDGPVRRGAPELDYDVVTELEFASADDFEAWQAALARPEVVARIRADEANFLVSGETRMWRVSPHESDYSQPPHEPAESRRMIDQHINPRSGRSSPPRKFGQAEFTVIQDPDTPGRRDANTTFY